MEVSIPVNFGGRLSESNRIVLFMHESKNQELSLHLDELKLKQG